MKKNGTRIILTLISLLMFYLAMIRFEFVGYLSGYLNSNLNNSEYNIIMLNARINKTPELLQYKTIQNEIKWELDNYEQAKSNYKKSDNILIRKFEGFETFPDDRFEKAKKELEGKLDNNSSMKMP